MKKCDVLVIGAGFGGLGAALRLAESGAHVVVCEALKYPGGCASTFTRQHARFEAGATLFAGMGPAQLFGRWIKENDLPVVADALDPVISLRTAGWELALHAQANSVRDQLCAMPNAPVRELHAFFALQQDVADTLWPLLDNADLLPPFNASALGQHVLRSPRYLRLLPLMGQPLGALLERLGLAGFAPLQLFLDAMCQITVQCSASVAETPFALAAVDYYARGAAHIRGGVGTLAHALATAVTARGGEVLFSNRVKAARKTSEGWHVQTRQGDFIARQVVANVLPQAAASLVDEALPHRMRRLVTNLEGGWSAAMLYGILDPTPRVDGPCHLQLIGDSNAPLMEGNHVFLSASGPRDGERAPDGGRTVTVSTHVPMPTWRALDPQARGDYVAGIQACMQRTVQARAPDWAAAMRSWMPASPRTFERFTQRPEGLVGGVPRVASLQHYADLFVRPVWPQFYLVGDSVFPGQSILAAALGGVRVAKQLMS